MRLQATTITAAMIIATVGLASGCTAESSQPTAAPSSSPASASGSPAVSGGAAASPESTAAWCQNYVTITNNLGSLGETAADAKTGLAVLPTFEQMWRTAGSMGIVTAEQAQANVDTIKAFQKVLEVVADGGTAEQIKQADADFTAGAEKLRPTLTAAAAAVTKACGLTAPSASAS